MAIIRNNEKKTINTGKKRTHFSLNNKYDNYTKYIIFGDIIYLFLLLITFNCLADGKILFLTKLDKFSEINLTLIGNGSQTILCTRNLSFNPIYYKFNSKPSEILVNGIKVKNAFKVNNLVYEENNITLRWNYPLTFCGLMFFGLDNIKNIDLSNFDSSQCTNILAMFAHCTSLTSINLNNFNTTLVTNFRNLFYNCISLISINLSTFDTSLVTNMYGMFYNCILLKNIDLNNFNTSLVVDLHGLFYNCFSLESVNIANFDTSLVTDISYMFCNCQPLKFLNLSHFNTSSVNNIRAMFYNCTSLISLDISSFDTSLITNYYAMFYNCIELKSLDINHFDTSLADTMLGMFNGCKSLTSLDLSNFNISLATDVSKMFQNCKSLLTLEINNFDFSSTSAKGIFDGCNDNLIYCIYNEYNFSILRNYSFQNNCSYICNLKSKKYIYENKKCVYNCFDDDIYKFEYNNKCYQSCPNGTNNFNNNYLCHKIVDNFVFDDINFFYRLYKNSNISKDYIVKNLRNQIINNSLDSLIEIFIEKDNEDLIYYKNNIIYQITSTFNQNYKKYYNISSIDFQEF